MKVFLTGATGFVGHEVVRQLIAKGHTPHCLVRPGSEGKMRALQGVEIRHGDGIGETARRERYGGLEGTVAVAEQDGVGAGDGAGGDGCRAGHPGLRSGSDGGPGAAGRKARRQLRNYAARQGNALYRG